MARFYLVALALWPMSWEFQVLAAPGGTPCTRHSLVVLVVGSPETTALEVERFASDVVVRDPCMRLIDVVESLEKGMAKGYDLVEEAREQADLGRAAFADMKLEKARLHFERARKAYAGSMAYVPYWGHVAEAFFYLSATYAALGMREQAVRTAMEALVLSPSGDIRTYSPLAEAVDAYERAKRYLASGKRGTLMVDTGPTPFQVFIDGKFAGVTPFSDPATPAGPHFVVLRRPGYERPSGIVFVEPGDTAVLGPQQLTLAPAERKRLMDDISRQLLEATIEQESSAMETVRGAFVVDLALLARLRQVGGGLVLEVGLWDLANHRKVFAGRYPAEGTAGFIGRGSVMELVSRALSRYEAATTVGLASVAKKPPATSKPVWKKWWFWTAIGGAVAVGGTVATVLLLRSQPGHGLKHDGTGAIVLRF